MSIYTKDAQDIYAEFAKVGVSVSIQRQTYTTNVGAGSSTPTTPAPASYPTFALILPASKGTVEAFDNRLSDGSLKKKELRYVKLAAYGLPYVPVSGDKLTFSGRTWEILGCTPVDITGSDPLLYGVGVVGL